MASTNSKVNVTKAQNENYKRILQQLLRLDDNRRCADCNARGPTWASVNLGVFVCLNCSGVHRSLGTHLSKVRSTTLDTWLPEQVAFVEVMGNRKANLFWEAELPAGFHRPFEGDMEGLKNFIGNKYRDQAYAMRTWDKSPTIDNYTFHPFMTQFGGAEAPAAAPISPPTSPPPEAASPPSTNGISSTVARALGPPPGGASRRAATDPPSRAATPPPAAAAAPPTHLFDLLSMDEAPASAPAAPSHGAIAAAAPASADDGGWAAFAESSSAPAAVPAAEDEDPWDAFQTAMSSAPAHPSSRTDPGHVATEAAAADLAHLTSQPAENAPARQPSPYASRSSTPVPPMNLFQGLQTHEAGPAPAEPSHQPHAPADSSSMDFAQLMGADPFAQPGDSAGFAHFPPAAAELAPQSRAQSAPTHDNTFVANFPEVPPALQQAAKMPQASHAHKRSADDIMKMFDKPAGSPHFGVGQSGFNAAPQYSHQQSSNQMASYSMYNPSSLGMQGPYGNGSLPPRAAGPVPGYLQGMSNVPAATASSNNGSSLSFF